MVVSGLIPKLEGASEFSLRPRRSVVRDQWVGQGVEDLDRVSMVVMAVVDTEAGVEEDPAVVAAQKPKNLNLASCELVAEPSLFPTFLFLFSLAFTSFSLFPLGAPRLTP
jgi:hypothetical protein